MKISNEIECSNVEINGEDHNCIIYYTASLNRYKRFNNYELEVDEIKIEEVFGFDKENNIFTVDLKTITNISALKDMIYNKIIDQSDELYNDNELLRADDMLDLYNELKEWN